MSSPNCTITFDAKNALVSGVTADDEIILSVAMTAFDLATKTNKVMNTTKSGKESSSKFYAEDIYTMEILDGGLVTFENLSTTDLTTAYMEMFLRSVDNSEDFTITDMDDSDASIDVKLKGSWSRTRRSASFVDKFNYSFTVRKAL